ncbi:unnamed protein product [Caenorhabditis angaria]|uniref:Uncharacterized protein n=1 Tax=Caenorhabditis angaria TaxID=860376 RepID=A0A9P1IHA8_9PELO|nr:unnamed protein product [Caenorhabditis angaria]
MIIFLLLILTISINLICGCLKFYSRKGQMKEGRHEMYVKRGKKFDERNDKNLEFTRRKVELASPADFQHDLIPHSTQQTSSDDDRDSILDPFVFSDAELPDEDLGELKLIPTVDSQILKHVRHRARDEMDCLKSPEPYTYQEEEDSLYNVPSIQWDPNSIRSSVQQNRKLQNLAPNSNPMINSARSHYVYPHNAQAQTPTVFPKNRVE